MKDKKYAVWVWELRDIGEFFCQLAPRQDNPLFGIGGAKLVWMDEFTWLRLERHNNSCREVAAELRSYFYTPSLTEASSKTFVATGHWNPLHDSHIAFLEDCRKIAGNNKLVIVCSSDRQVKQKGGAEFMNQKERMAIVSSLKFADEVVLAIDEDKTVAKTLEMIKPDFFVKGSDRNPSNSTSQEMPQSELDVCAKNGIKIIYSSVPVGNSSTAVKNRMRDNIMNEILDKADTDELKSKIKSLFNK